MFVEIIALKFPVILVKADVNVYTLTGKMEEKVEFKTIKRI